MAQQLAAGIGEGFVAALLAQQRHAHLVFQALHVLGHRGLRAGQVAAGFGEACVVGDGDEGAQQVEVQGG
ncbi:hypothetical protein D3C80_2099210 [compost metagenome]